MLEVRGPARRAHGNNCSGSPASPLRLAREGVRDQKQRFSRWYNKRTGRRGFFWGERFKSVIVENGGALVNCLAYFDLNPARAGLVEKPENDRWSSLGYHVQTGNAEGFLSLDLGLRPFADLDDEERLRGYRRFVHYS